MPSVTIYANRFALIQFDAHVNIHTGSRYRVRDYSGGKPASEMDLRDYMYLGFEFADVLNKKHVYKYIAQAYASNRHASSDGRLSLHFGAIFVDWDETKVTNWDHEWYHVPSYVSSDFVKSGSAPGYISGIETTDPTNQTIGITEFFEHGMAVYTFGSFENGKIAYCDIDTPYGANKPYITIYYETATPFVSASYKSKDGVFVNRKKDSKIEWFYRTNATFGRVEQASYKFRYRKAGETSHTEIFNSSKNDYHVIPANTLDSGNYEWQVVCTTEDGVESAPSEWTTFTTIDVAHTALITYPNSVAIDGAKDTVFTWLNIASTGTDQTKYDAEYSEDLGITWTALSSGETSNTFFVVKANTFYSGNKLWRVRVYNQEMQPGAWSDPAPFVVRVAPPQPIVSANSQPLCTVQWQVIDQVAYRITCDGYDSGVVPGSAKEHKIPFFLPDGDIEINVTIQNAMGLWSIPGTTIAKIKNVPIAEIALSASKICDHSACLEWDTLGGFTQYYIYRNNTLIDKVSNKKTYIDYSSVGENQYTVRGVYEDGYALSNVSSNYTPIHCGLISLVEDHEWIYLHCNIEQPFTHDLSITPNIEYVFYSGRNMPVANISKQKSRIHKLTYSLLTRDDYLKLEQMAGKEVIYKDNRGDFVYGILDGLDTSRTLQSSNITISISEVELERVEISV